MDEDKYNWNFPEKPIKSQYWAGDPQYAPGNESSGHQKELFEVYDAGYKAGYAAGYDEATAALSPPEGPDKPTDAQSGDSNGR